MKEKTFGERLVYYRERKGLKQNELARLAEVSATALNYYEKDKREPSVPIIMRLVKSLDITGDELLWGPENELDIEDSNLTIYAVDENNDKAELLDDTQVKDYLDELMSLPKEALGELRIVFDYLKFKYRKD